MALCQPVKYSCALPDGGQDVTGALLPDEEYSFTYNFSLTQMAIAAVTVAEDSVRNAGFAKEAVPTDLGNFT